MIEIFSTDQCEKMDSCTINEICIPSLILMENASISVFNEIVNMGDSYLIICGKGNNGGDALAIGRHLLLAGKSVKFYIVSENEKFSHDFEVNLEIVQNLTNKIRFVKKENDINESVINDLKVYDILLDGIFGIGLNKEVRGIFRKIIDEINKYSNLIVSIDVPSGLDCNLGCVLGTSIRANYTYTFEVVKRGFLNYEAIEYLGELKVLGIGIPQHIKQKNSGNIYILDKSEYKHLVPERKVYGHKGNYGRAIIVAGKSGFTGAAFITTECTVRAGAGLTTLICPKDIQSILSSRVIEAMTINFEDANAIEVVRNADSIAIGPGIGTEKDTAAFFEKVIKNSKSPIIIDADGINLLAEKKQLLANLKGRAIITPHPGEMARFLGITIEEVERDRINITKDVAQKYDIVVLLKGHNTVISDGKKTYINPTGNSKMATGGMGDALTGIINAFLSQKVELYKAALLSAYIHGNIADELKNKFYIVNARDIIAELPRQINNIINS